MVMIRLAIMSDLHVEKGSYQPPPIKADLVVLAGDVGWGLDGVDWIAGHLAPHPTIYVPGNREHWHHEDGIDPVEALRDASAPVPGLRFLCNGCTEYEFRGRRLRVLGATLWTDYALEGDAPAAMEEAEAKMPDYRNGRGSDGKKLTPQQVLAWNRVSVAYLESMLAQKFDGVTMVVTHHAPSVRSLKQRRPDHVPTIASVTSLEPMIEAHQPELWVHGHIHWDEDYHIGRTRVVSHQRGGPEHEGYLPKVVLV